MQFWLLTHQDSLQGVSWDDHTLKKRAPHWEQSCLEVIVAACHYQPKNKANPHGW